MEQKTKRRCPVCKFELHCAGCLDAEERVRRAYNQGMRDALEMLKQSAEGCIAAIDESEDAEVHPPDPSAS